MRIADSLRQECMPEMIYSICKLVGSKSYSKDEIKRLISLDCEETSNFNKAYRFAIECEFVKENDDNKVKTNFSDKQLSSFVFFRYAIFEDVFTNSSTTFTSLAKWFLTQNTDVFTLKSAESFAAQIPNDMFAGVEKDYILGFRFWMTALGLGMFSKSGASDVLVFATNNILKNWVEISKPFKKGSHVLAKEFFERLQKDCPVFADCIKGNDINISLSLGLRVLHTNNLIELKYTTDSGDIWHLTNSISNPHTNNITEIIVR